MTNNPFNPDYVPTENALTTAGGGMTGNLFRNALTSGGGGIFSGRRRRELLREQAAFAKANYGYINGVLFDFRHEELKPGRWEIPGPVNERMLTHEGFYIKADEPTLRSALVDLTDADAESDLETAVTALSAQQDAAAVRDRMFILRPGDCVKVSMAEVHELPDAEPFASEPDRFGALVYFTIHRADGTTEDGGHAWLFHSACMVHGLAEWKARRKLMKRLALLGEERPDKEDEAFTTVCDLVARLDKKLHSVTEALWDQQDKLEGEGLLKGFFALTGPVYDVEDLVNLALLCGYRQGHLEASCAMKPMAEAGFEKRRAELLRGWEARDRDKEEFADRYWREVNPTATFYEVLQQFNARPDAGVALLPTQFNKAVGHVCPATSPSYTTPAAAEARVRQKERRAFGIH